MHTSAARALALRTSGVTYPGSIEHVSAVRADLRALLHDCPRTDDVILCASELAANAALHSHSRVPGGTFTVRATVIPNYVRIEGEDNGGPWTGDTSDSTGHHGWDIVRALADGWGVEDDRNSRTIWHGSNGPNCRNQTAVHDHGGVPGRRVIRRRMIRRRCLGSGDR
ncbi:MAG: ATP-binding protein [Streptosporangiaceae bacterium]